MYSVQSFILVGLLAASASAVTNIEVNNALNSFNKNLDAQTTQLLSQNSQIAKLNSQVTQLQAALAENTKLTCDAETCPKKNLPVPVGCSWSNGNTSHAALVWNTDLCGPYDEARRGNLTCFLVRHNVKDMETCLQSLREVGRRGPQGCFNKSSGSCTCALDTTLETRDYDTAFSEAYNTLNRYTAYFKSEWGSWNGGALRTPDGIEYPEYKMKMRYDCLL